MTGTRTAKVAHVLSANQTRDHGCHWPGCTRQVPPAMWGCKPHWFQLPLHIRNAIWLAYAIGQEVAGTPNDDYLEAAQAAQDWIAANG